MVVAGFVVQRLTDVIARINFDLGIVHVQEFIVQFQSVRRYFSLPSAFLSDLVCVRTQNFDDVVYAMPLWHEFPVDPTLDYGVGVVDEDGIIDLKLSISALFVIGSLKGCLGLGISLLYHV